MSLNEFNKDDIDEEYGETNCSNLCATMQFEKEIDVGEMAKDMNMEDEYEPEEFPALTVKDIFSVEGKSTAMIFESGSVNVMGMDSFGKLETVVEEVEELVESYIGETDYDIRMTNSVVTTQYEKNFKLNVLILKLGLEESEYEPEQFPAILHNPENHNGTVAIFSKGSVNFVGEPNSEKLNELKKDMEEKLGISESDEDAGFYDKEEY